jgi:DNA processing protein
LIRQGAKLVETAADIIEELPPGYVDMASVVKPAGDRVTNHMRRTAGLSVDERRLLEVIGTETVTLDQLLAGAGLDTRQLSVFLAQLELRGLVCRTADGRFQGILSPGEL